MPRPDPSRSRVVLVGVPEYEDPALGDVPQIRNNVTDLLAVLTDPDLGGLAAEHCRVAPWRSSVAEVGRLLRTAAQEAEDLLLFYYSGHGMLSALRRELYLGVYASEHEAPSFSALPFHAVRDAWIRSPATSRVVILDCCFSGRAIGDTLAELDSLVIEQVGVSGTYTLAASPGNSVAMVLDGERHTAFSGRLLELLRTGVPGAGDVLDLGTLYRHLLTRMRADGLPHPQQRGTETADLLGLVRNRRSTPPDDATLLLEAYDRGESGDRDGAIRLYRALVPRLTKTLGAGHPRTLAARHGLAHNLGENGATAEAAKLFRELVPERVRVDGATHPDAIDARRRLAFYTAATGDLTGAIKLYDDVLADLHPRSADALRVRRQLAFFLGEHRDQRALALYLDLLSEMEASDHPQTDEVRREYAYFRAR